MRTNEPADGSVVSAERQGDMLAIGDLVVSYGFAVDDKDWTRWEALFTPDAFIDYTHSGGITGTPAEIAAWLPGAMEAFMWTMHSVLTHEIRFTGPDTANGRLHLFNRNAIEWQGTTEFADVGGLYLDEYRKVGDAWRSRAGSNARTTSPVESSPRWSAASRRRLRPTKCHRPAES